MLKDPYLTWKAESWPQDVHVLVTGTYEKDLAKDNEISRRRDYLGFSEWALTQTQMSL